MMSQINVHEIRRKIRNWASPFDLLLFLLALLIYALTRFIQLEDFPIYFFTDEAVQTILASDFVRDGLHGYDKVLLPTYFENSFLFNLSVSVYLQVIPYLIFGKSIFVTRAVPALITLTAAGALSLTLKRIFALRYWWLGSLLLAITPAWFLHSRTAFEATLFVSFLAWFLYFYLLYRKENPVYIYAAIVFGALAFYSYRGGQIVLMGLTILLLISDFQYHKRQNHVLIRGMVLAILLSLPYIRFQLQHGGETYFQLRLMESVLFRDIPVVEKAQALTENYLAGLDPRYWYNPELDESPRHFMRGYGHILILTAPFALLGFLQTVRKIKTSEYRTILMVAITAPLGGVFVAPGITRNLSFIIAAAIFTAIGIIMIGQWLERWFPYKLLAAAIFTLLSLTAFAMTRDALINGPTWYDDYGITGLQFGGKQVFTQVEHLSNEDPDTTIYVSPTWANGTGIIKRFFIPDDVNVRMGNVTGFLEEMGDLNSQMLFVLPEPEYNDIVDNEKLNNIRVENIINYPDGRPGFYFVRMEYAPNASAIFTAEEEERNRPKVEELDLNGETVQIQYPYLDMGGITHIFDGDNFTLARVYEANPAVFTLSYSTPRFLRGLRATTGSMDFQICVRLYSSTSEEIGSYCEAYYDQPDDPTVVIEFEHPNSDINVVEIEIFSLEGATPNKIHVRELELF
jgi:hypothetical protein